MGALGDAYESLRRSDGWSTRESLSVKTEDLPAELLKIVQKIRRAGLEVTVTINVAIPPPGSSKGVK